MSRLDRKLKVLRDEQIALAEEAALNETLGVSVAERVKSVAKPQEANKFKTHVQEVGHITSLLLSLSGRLARAENALLDLDADHLEKVNNNNNNRQGSCVRACGSDHKIVTKIHSGLYFLSRKYIIIFFSVTLIVQGCTKVH